MKFASAIVLLALACYVNSAVLVPEDVPVLNKPGECPSGLPVDGRFKSCALSPDAWRIGARTYGDAISESDINFSTDFAFPSPLLAEELTNDTTSTCAVRIPASGVVFQHMEYLLHAHYRLTGCAKVHGRSPCRIEVRDFYNRIVDKIEFPWNNVTCSSNRANCLEWTSGSSLEWRNITIRYEGHVPADIAVLMASDSLNLNDTSSAVTFSVMPGDEFTLTGADFASSGSSASDVLPSRLAFITNNNWVDILSLSDVPTALPGQRFGDQSRFLMAKAGVSDKWLCPISEGADLLTCPCEDAEVEQVCMESLKGFVADPEHEYYIGLVSDECSCEFDNICLSQVGNQEGYFGLNWILNNNSSRA